MSTQRECSLNSLLGEIRELKERMRQTFPSYTASLKELSSLPEEFERRFWAFRVEALLQVVKVEYESFQAKAQKVGSLGKYMTLGVDTVLKAGGMEPVALPGPLQLGITISPSRKIEPAILDEDFRQQDTTIVSMEGFEAIARRVQEQIIKGEVLPETDEEILRLVYQSALELP